MEYFNVHDFIAKEKNAFEVNPESSKIWENLHRVNHAYFVRLFFEVSEKIEGQNIEKGLDSIYTTTKNLFKFNNESKKENILLNWAIDPNQKGGRQLDSYQLSLIYSDLTKIHDVPISVVRARDYFFIQYEEDKFFDPLTSKKLKSSDIKKAIDISEDSVDNGIYLTPLKGKQLLAVEYARMGKFVADYLDLYFDYCIETEIPFDDNYSAFLARKAFSGFENAIINDIKNIDALEFMGDFCYKMRLNNDALSDYNRILEVDPNNKKIRNKVEKIIREENSNKL